MRSKEPDPRTRYINEIFAPEDEHLLAIRAELIKDNKLGINIEAYEGRLLQVLIAMNKVESIVEIGTLYGYSALWMARALPSEGSLICLEKNPDSAQKAVKLLGRTEVSQKIEVICGEATEKLRLLESRGPFDMCFIDANKSGYEDYLDWAIQNVKSGGLIVGDNSFLFGQVYENQESEREDSRQIKVMKNFNSRLSNHDQFFSVLLPTSEGLTIALKK